MDLWWISSSVVSSSAVFQIFVVELHTQIIFRPAVFHRPSRAMSQLGNALLRFGMALACMDSISGNIIRVLGGSFCVFSCRYIENGIFCSRKHDSRVAGRILRGDDARRCNTRVSDRQFERDGCTLCCFRRYRCSFETLLWIFSSYWITIFLLSVERCDLYSSARYRRMDRSRGSVSNSISRFHDAILSWRVYYDCSTYGCAIRVT